MSEYKRLFGTVPDIDPKREQVVSKRVALEGINAEQIRKSKKAHGGGKPQPDLREEGWRAAERGKRVQPSRQRKKREAAREKSKQEVEAPQRALGVGPYVRSRRYPDA